MSMKRIIIGIFCCAAWAVTAAEVETKNCGYFETAAFANLSQHAQLLGRQIANPIMPLLILSSIQQQLASEYGPLRVDKPLKMCGYSRVPGRDFEGVIIYPLSKRIAQMVLDTPGAERVNKDTVRFRRGEGEATTNEFAVFVAAEHTAAFASSEALARRAHTDAVFPATAPKNFSAPFLARAYLTTSGVTTLAAYANGIGVSNLNEIATGVSGLYAHLSITEKGACLDATVLPAKGAKLQKKDFPLQQWYDELIHGLAPMQRSAVKENTEVIVEPQSDGTMRLALKISATGLNKIGAAVNKSITESMLSPALNSTKP